MTARVNGSPHVYEVEATGHASWRMVLGGRTITRSALGEGLTEFYLLCREYVERTSVHALRKEPRVLRMTNRLGGTFEDCRFDCPAD